MRPGHEFAAAFSAEITDDSLGQLNSSFDNIDVAFKSSYWGVGAAWRPSFGTNGFGGVVRAGAAFTTGKIETLDVSFSHSSTQPYLGLG